MAKIFFDSESSETYSAPKKFFLGGSLSIRDWDQTGNVVKNKHTKLEQHRIIFSLSNFGRTPKKFKVHGGGGMFFKITKLEKGPTWGMLQGISILNLNKIWVLKKIFFFGVGCLSTRDDWAEAGNVVKNEYTKFEQDRSIEKKNHFWKNHWDEAGNVVKNKHIKFICPICFSFCPICFS